MLRLPFIFFSFLFICLQANAQLAYSVHPRIYYSEDGGYLENYLGIQSKTVTLKEGVGILEYIVQITKGEPANTVHIGKYAIEVTEENRETDLWDVQRYALTDGTYQLLITLVDQYGSDTIGYDIKLEVSQPINPTLSKPLLCSALGKEDGLPFEKYGFKYEKLAYDLVSEEQNILYFFQEYYHPSIQPEDVYFIKYSVVKELRNPSMLGEVLFSGYERLNPTSQGIYTKAVDVSLLQSGDYHLLTEYIDKEKNQVAVNFQNFQVMRPNQDLILMMEKDQQFETSWVKDFTPEESIYALKALAPRIDGQRSEILNQILYDRNLRRMQYFIYAYWKESAPSYTEEAYQSYMKVAKAVDQTYRNNVGFGFENDRGFYFLKYGKPDVVITEEHEPTAPPYEIWIYNKLENTGETDIKFLFYNPSLSGNDYQILHSNSNFDIRNPDWQRSLYNQAQGEVDGAFNSGQIGDNYQRNAVNYFNNF